MKNDTGMFGPQWRWRRCLPVLLAGSLAACGGSGRDAAPAPAAAAVTEGIASAVTTYSVVNLDPAQSSLDPIINTNDQVAFTGQRGQYYRAGFFDGDTIRAIGPFGGNDSFAQALNDAGQVAVDAPDAAGIMTAYRWTATGGLVRLGPLHATVETRATGINRDGLITGFAGRPFPDEYSRAAVWNAAGVAQDLGTLGGLWSFGMAINAAGTVAGSSQLADGTRHAFAWTAAGGMTDLGTMGGSASDARLINDAGQVAGLLSPTATDWPYHGFAWDRVHGMADIGTLGGMTSFVRAMNASGRLVGFADLPCDLCAHAISWTRTGGLADLGTLGGNYSDAFGVNRLGQVVGWAQLDAAHSGIFHAFVWSAAEGMIDLNQRVPSIPTGLVLTSALAIADSGAIVADSNAGLVLLVPGTGGTDAPVVGPIAVGGPVVAGTRATFSADFTDRNRADTHAAAWFWGDDCTHTPGTVLESDGAGTASGDHLFCNAGVYPVALTVTDNTGLRATVSRDVVVLASTGAAVGGGGWFMSPQGAYRKQRIHAGRASFSFVSAVSSQGAGPMTLKFHVADMVFRSAGYESLSVAGSRVQYQGSGTINGKGDYKFLLTAVDGSTSKAIRTSRLRLKVWHVDARSRADVVDYDNQGAARTLAAAGEGSVIGGGIVIRR